MISFPFCKINLGLHILSLRPDGYHAIETVFYPIPWFDILEVIPATTLLFTCTGISIPGEKQDNLCLKAYQLLKQDFDLPAVAIHLHKIIPIGAGLGGGSSDAVHMLKQLDQLFNLRLSKKKIKEYALHLGSDCAYFLHEGPMLGSGRGEILSALPISLRGKSMVLVYPKIPISSTQAYADTVPSVSYTSLPTILENDISMWKNMLVNAFEKTVFIKYPILEEVKKMLYTKGALYASMSGSGSVVFGVFDTPISLEHCFPNMVYWSGEL